MSKIVLTYFDAPGLGEPCRLLLAYGGEEFEDRRITKEEWPSIKPNTPFGQVPMIEFDGKKYSQSLAIARYLGHKYNLAGDTLEDALEIDQNIDLFNDLKAKATPMLYETDEAIKDAKFAELSKSVFPEYMERLNSIISKNNGHLAIGKLTWGDLLIVGYFDGLRMMLRMPEFEKQYPAFQQLYDNVISIPNIKAYYAARKAAKDQH